MLLNSSKSQYLINFLVKHYTCKMASSTTSIKICIEKKLLHDYFERRLLYYITKLIRKSVKWALFYEGLRTFSLNNGYFNREAFVNEGNQGVGSRRSGISQLSSQRKGNKQDNELRWEEEWMRTAVERKQKIRGTFRWETNFRGSCFVWRFLSYSKCCWDQENEFVQSPICLSDNASAC